MFEVKKTDYWKLDGEELETLEKTKILLEKILEIKNFEICGYRYTDVDKTRAMLGRMIISGRIRIT